jgi:hypothetical protein
MANPWDEITRILSVALMNGNERRGLVGQNYPKSANGTPNCGRPKGIILSTVFAGR